ncbi:MAG: CPBP family intramembrane metalloprotease [Erysipelotrichaceae bacterium]|nr:CPBP family intramembrane metalloprotease [Erysipelotrichaceae bacterium]
MKRRSVVTVIIAMLATAMMILIEQYLKPGYWIKSLFKIVIFAGTMIAYCLLYKISFKEAINFRKLKGARILYVLCGCVYAVVIIAFLIARNYMNMDSIKAALIGKEHLTRENCLFVFAYIIIVNSFLEESFFRGFIFNQLKEVSVRFAAVFSGLMFALYHIGIVSGWFNPVLFVICIAALCVSGMFLQGICEHFGSLKASWLLHGFANIAINTIGVILMFDL